jgi:NADH-quinone oxidoreductase subunit H
MDWVDLLIVAVQVLVAFGLLLVVTLLLIWIERKLVADMQTRIGPERAGPWGILQSFADGMKLFFKEQVTPRKVELGVYLMAPVFAIIPSVLMFLVIPIGAPVTIGARRITFQVTDLNVGVLYVLAMSSIAVYAVVMAGWASGSKYPLLGAIRATAQAISYEAALGLALVPVIAYAGTMSLAEMVERQAGTFEGAIVGLSGMLRFIPAWNIFPMFVSFVIFFIAAVAETNRAPFDLVEAEQELVGGFHTEYSGIRFAMFFLAEYIAVFNMSALVTTFFLGGWNGPTFGNVLPAAISALLPLVYFFAKTAIVVFVFFWIRATLPRLRYDQLMMLGWKRLIPAALAWLVVSTLAVGVRDFGLPWT